MLFRGGLICALLIGGGWLAACSLSDDGMSPTQAPKGPFDYKLTLLVDSTQVYGCANAENENPYCRTTARDSSRDSLTVHIPVSAVDTTTATWIQAGYPPPLPPYFTVLLRGAGSLSADGSLTVSVNDRYNIHCDGFDLAGMEVNGQVGGTFSQELDCHGAMRWGHFAGHR